MIIFYNPACSKCNEALNLLENSNCEVSIREYLTEPPSVEELAGVLKKLGCKSADLVRRSEPLFIEQFSDKELTEEQWIEVLCKNPILIERPIVIDGEKAIIGRPPKLVLELIPEVKNSKT
jgi:arsenate reductase